MPHSRLYSNLAPLLVALYLRYSFQTLSEPSYPSALRAYLDGLATYVVSVVFHCMQVMQQSYMDESLFENVLPPGHLQIHPTKSKRAFSLRSKYVF